MLNILSWPKMIAKTNLVGRMNIPNQVAISGSDFFKIFLKIFYGFSGFEF